MSKVLLIAAYCLLLLAGAALIGVGGVEEVDPQVEGAVDDALLFRLLLGPLPEQQVAETEGAHLDAGAPERSVLHY